MIVTPHVDQSLPLGRYTRIGERHAIRSIMMYARYRIMNEWIKLRDQIVVWEDDTALVVNKPPGLSVMGERHGADLVSLAAAGGEELWWVHRIDKVTSGAVALAKTKESHAAITRQFAKRTVDKAYLAICQPGDIPEHGTIDLPLFTASSGRIRVAAQRQNIEYDEAASIWSVGPADLLAHRNYPSRTDFLNLWDDSRNAVLLAMPVTGRRHQIRVHFAWIGHAIVGDPLFSKKSDPPASRTYLHSLRIAFESASPGRKWVEVETAPTDDFWAPVMDRLAPSSPDILMHRVDALLNDRPSTDPDHKRTPHA